MKQELIFFIESKAFIVLSTLIGFAFFDIIGAIVGGAISAIISEYIPKSI